MACVRSRSIFTGTLSKSVLQACLCPPRWNQHNTNILCTPYPMGSPPEIPGFPALPPLDPLLDPWGFHWACAPPGGFIGSPWAVVPRGPTPRILCTPLVPYAPSPRPQGALCPPRIL